MILDDLIGIEIFYTDGTYEMIESDNKMPITIDCSEEIVTLSKRKNKKERRIFAMAPLTSIKKIYFHRISLEK